MNSSHSPGAAAALTLILDQGLPGDLAPDLHICSQSPRTLSPAEAHLSSAGISGKGRRRRWELPLAEHLLGAKTFPRTVSIHPHDSRLGG